MKWGAVLLAVLCLSACGIDGRPKPPENAVPDDGIAGIGVVGEA